MADWKDILSGTNEAPESEELLNYLEDNLSEEAKHDFEKKTIDSLMVNDALEGLDSFKKKERLNQYVLQLNKDLQQQLAAKKQRKLKRRLKDNPWIIITILLLLAICIFGYAIIHMYYLNK